MPKTKDQYFEALLDTLFKKGYRFFPEYTRRLYRQKKNVIVELYDALRYGKFADFVRDVDKLNLSKEYLTSIYPIYS